LISRIVACLRVLLEIMDERCVGASARPWR
jgi:hypothetical protein